MARSKRIEKTKARIDWRGNAAWWALVGFLLLVFATGGGARPDIASLILLRPLAVLMCGFALWRIDRAQIAAHKFLFTMTLAVFALAILHLIPLPPAVWGALPGRTLMAEVDKAAGLGKVWRPVTMVPAGGWNALYALFVPLAVLLLGVQLTREQRFRLLPVVMGLGLLSGFIGLLQVIGDPQGPLYLYRITNNGAAVGLFANRNHQAILLACLFPMLAVYASAGVISEPQMRFRGWVAITAGIVLVPLLLVTGSRAGLITGVLGLAAAGLLYRKPQLTVAPKRTAPKISWRYPLMAFGLLVLAGLSVVMSRAEALERIMAPDALEEERFKLWPVVWRMVGKYFPVGSGNGSFVEVYQIDEPNALLDAQYYNHAHNDWLEVALTFGLPGILLLLVAVVAVALAARAAFLGGMAQGRDRVFARLGCIMLLLFAIASVGDYPVRTPIIATLFVIAALWLSGANAKISGSDANSPLAGVGQE